MFVSQPSAGVYSASSLSAPGVTTCVVRLSPDHRCHYAHAHGGIPMKYMLCRNRVRNFDNWKRVFDGHAGAHRGAGLKLVHLWQDDEIPSQVFFLFEIEDIARARAFVESHDAQKSAHESGLIEGEFHFFKESQGYGIPVPAAEVKS